MTRRTLLAALPQVLREGLEPDQWQELAEVWNPFAAKLNRGELDLKQWRRVVAAVEKIDGRKCK